MHTILPPRADHIPGLILAIDEAGNLLDRSDDPRERTMRITAFRRVFRSLRDYPVWALFLSTNGRTESFTTSRHYDQSNRISKGKLVRMEPFISLELNLEERRRRVSGGLSERFKPMKLYTSSDHMTGFGRPLWRLKNPRTIIFHDHVTSESG